MLYLNSNIRYRKEMNYILICDCKNLLDYELPICYEKLFAVLENGYDNSNRIGVPSEKEIIEDLKLMHIISEKKNYISPSNNDVWKSLRYSENEFYH